MDTDNLTLLRAELKRDEGVHLKPYTDITGHITIGTGRNLTDVGISQAENDYLLTDDITRVEQDLNQYLPWWTTLDPVRQRVLANMTFNMGIEQLLGFKQTLALIQCGDYKTASQTMLDSLWARQVGLRALRLSRMMETGQA